LATHRKNVGMTRDDDGAVDLRIRLFCHLDAQLTAESRPFLWA
jgi:hypothetical protein